MTFCMLLVGFLQYRALHLIGVRGCGETPIVAPLAAVGNAVSRVLNMRFTELPMSLPKVLEALSE